MENLASIIKEELGKESPDFIKLEELLNKAKNQKLVIDLKHMPRQISYEQVIFYINALDATLIDTRNAGDPETSN